MHDINLPSSGLAEDILMKYQEREFHIVTFNLGEEYAVPINQVQEIVRVGNITTVPNSPSYMEGVINLRGRVLPVLNLRKRLRLPAGGVSKASRIVVAEVGDKIIGLLVDSVSHVIKVPSGFIEAVPEEVLEVDANYLTGVGKLNDTLLILLDLEKLLKREKINLKEERNGGAAEN